MPAGSVLNIEAADQLEEPHPTTPTNASLAWSLSLGSESRWTTDAGVGRLDFRCELVVVANGSDWVDHVPITFTERRLAHGRSVVAGTDPTGSLTVEMSSSLPPTTVKLQFRFRPAPKTRPAELAPVVEVLDEMRAGRQLGLWSTHSDSWVVHPIVVTEDLPRLPDGYAATVSALAEVQRSSSVVFPMPTKISDEDAAALAVAHRLLLGRAATARWRKAEIVLESSAWRALKDAAGPDGALLEFVADYSVSISGHDIPLGRAQFRFWQVRFAMSAEAVSDDADPITVGIEAGDDNRYEVILVKFATGVDESRTDVERYAGRWIAQAEGQVLDVGNTPEEVVASLRRRGIRGAVWRVPTDHREAEALLSTSL